MSFIFVVFFFKQKTAYEMRISDWSSDVCSSDLRSEPGSIQAFLLSGLFDLTEAQLDRSRAAEDQHRHAQAALLVVDFLDHAIEVVERAVDDPDHLARLEQHLRLRLADAFLDPVQDRIGLVVRDRQRPVGGAADEPNDLRGFLAQVPPFTVHARSEEPTSELHALMRISYD